jgi:hypothetical protein
VIHLVQFSGGASSWAAAQRAIQRYGRRNVRLLFADTLIEDPDLWRFMLQAVQQLGARFTIIRDGRTPWQVFEDERFIGNTRVDVCSRILKRDPLAKYRDANFDPSDTVIHFGLAWYEPDRIERVRRAMTDAGWACDFPMCWEPLLDPEEVLALMESQGIRRPALYAEGFSHNNCGGRCVKAGHAQWAKLLEKRPAAYLESEGHERRLRGLGINGTILRDRRGGTTKPMTLETFRIRVQTEGSSAYDPNDVGGCGCALPGEST